MFENFPRRELPFAVSRRELFSALMREAQILTQATQGIQPFRLAELGTLTDQQLAGVMPTLNPDFEIYQEEGFVCAREIKTGRVYQEFIFQKENTFTFSLFTGEMRLDEIGKRVAKEMGWEEAKGFAHARGLFLSLVSHLVCLPNHPLDE